MTILFVFTCAVCVRGQRAKRLSQALGPLCLSHVQVCLTDHRISGLPNSCQIQTFQDNLWTLIWQLSYGFQFFFFELVVIKAWSWYFVHWFSGFVRQFAISFHALLGMTFHVVEPRGTYSGFKHGSVIVNNMFVFFAMSLSTSQVYNIKEWCWFSQIDFFVKYFPHRNDVFFLASQFEVIHIHR